MRNRNTYVTRITMTMTTKTMIGVDLMVMVVGELAMVVLMLAEDMSVPTMVILVVAMTG